MILIPPAPEDTPIERVVQRQKRLAASVVCTSAAMSIGWVADALSVLGDGPLDAEVEKVQRKLGAIAAELGILARKAMEGKGK